MRIHFELGDLRAFITVVNVMLIIKFGLSISWFGLAIAAMGFAIDAWKYYKRSADFRINSCVIHLANAVLNIFFISRL